MKFCTVVKFLHITNSSIFTKHFLSSQEGEDIDNITVCEYSKKKVQRYHVQDKSGCVYNRGSVLNYTFRVSQDTGNLVGVLVV